MKDAETLYQEREKRVLDAIALSVPDRVPILVMSSFYPAKRAGMTIQDVMYDPEKLWKAQWASMLELEQDMEQNPFGLRLLGPILEALDFKQLKWPGHGVASNLSYQFVEGEYMKPEEYDRFIEDPTDFMLRNYWPRVFGALSCFDKLPAIRNIITYSIGVPFGFAVFNTPEMIEALEALKKAGEQSAIIASYAQRFSKAAKEAGFPLQFGSFSQAPFDILSDYFRGMKGSMLDMYRRPDKVLKACEKILPIVLDMARGAAKMSGNPRVFIPLHKGLDGFMSEDQFKKFFWPTLRELMVTMIDEGLVPCPLWEGNCTTRLEIIKDIPRGKAIYAFEATDIFKAKEILGDTVCIRGNLPLSLLATGKPEDVVAYCKRLIDVVGKGGGYILDASAGLDDAREENVTAMLKFAKEYGVY